MMEKPAAQDSLSDEALLPLKTYKYSSVDKSYISNYILRHYVRSLSPISCSRGPDEANRGLSELVECRCRALTLIHRT
jgi:hypothetical protein